MLILIVEDEAKTLSFLQKGLEEAGFEVVVAIDGEEGLHHARSENPDVVILDVMLPKKDGWSVMRDLRDSGLDMPVMFLTAKDPVKDRVKGLELGADDYLVKPFAFSELLARIRALHRRGREPVEDIIQIRDLTIDLKKHVARRGEHVLDLTPREFSLLVLMARRVGEVLPRSLILKKVWNITFNIDTNVLDVTIRRLRGKVDDPFPEKMIYTVRGVGYVIKNET